MTTSAPRVQRIRGRRRVERNQRILATEKLCRPCRKAGRLTLATEVDHIKPLMHGGTEDPENLQPICRSCNDLKAIAEQGRNAKPRDIKGLDWA